MQQREKTISEDAWQLEVILAKLGSTHEIDFRGSGGAFNLKQHGSRIQNLAIQQLVECLGLDPMLSARDAVEARLRVALHLAPIEAINYDSRSTKSRKRYIADYLQENFLYPREVALEVGRFVAKILDRWDADRRAVSGHRDRLLLEQGYRCASCHLDFSSSDRLALEEARALRKEDDPFKPYFDGNGVVEWMRPEVDHKIAVSKDGSNNSDNLQVICRLCNHGKGSGGAITAETELEHCATPVRSIPRSFRMRVFFNRIRIDKYECQKCGSSKEEITIRMRHSRGLFTLSNLMTLCGRCAES